MPVLRRSIKDSTTTEERNSYKAAFDRAYSEAMNDCSPASFCKQWCPKKAMVPTTVNAVF